LFPDAVSYCTCAGRQRPRHISPIRIADMPRWTVVRSGNEGVP